jgi:hypothetical protein
MGNVQASSNKNMVELANQFINNTTNTNSTDSSATAINRQTFDVLIGQGSDVKGCDLNILNSITSSQALKTTSTANFSTKIKNDLSNMIDQIASTSQDAVAEFMSLSGNAQLSVQELSTSIKNSIENNITNENTTVCKAYVENLQDGKLTILGKYTCGPSGKIEINQQIVNDQLSECISKVFFDAIADNSIVNDIVQKAETEQKAKTVGPIGALFGNIGGIIGIVIVLILIIVLGVGGYIAYKKFAGGSMPKGLPLLPGGGKPQLKTTGNPLTGGKGGADITALASLLNKK